MQLYNVTSFDAAWNFAHEKPEIAKNLLEPLFTKIVLKGRTIKVKCVIGEL